MSFSEKLSVDFLSLISDEYKLTDMEKNVLILRFHYELDYQEISDWTKSNQAAVNKRMGQVYKRFSIEGDTKGKEVTLRQILNQKFREYKKIIEYNCNNSNLEVIVEEIKKIKEKLNEIEMSKQFEQGYSLSRNNNDYFNVSDWNNNITVFIQKLIEKLKNTQEEISSQDILHMFPIIVERIASQSDSYDEKQITLMLLETLRNRALDEERYLTMQHEIPLKAES
ncbi:hypothetical protein G7B40_037645 [Aetokthonos hydrillicola Thurmond2011]|jgi:hypothetical protein|uniref:Uncharacterized protein n=1 Tax=Aetokthonos hydrillicola Thurmond2011 TaxID=2712845 RepID=A0AAP5IEJ7_9CYAN|nr:hypothetical protein [Aetokthonos hydrillicola]MBO3461206.1 hypothetical protein [Aetokthonos hydrillicola CCALA 1050]MBW4589740.1 hypothetical protein [Aetokthonos hydrillicola CCALA 1050]MDR9900235.1 hypothetical protein [Aetokthonos hydrillicola Thurmond2011]